MDAPAPMPVLFLSHGPPTFAVEDSATARHWAQLPGRLPGPPKAIVCVSAHWDAPATRVAGGVSRPAIQHDFSGFPDALYRETWDVLGSRPWADRVLGLLGEGAAAEPERPLDHGVWVPLRRAWPDGEVPVLQVSLSTARGGAWHLELGRRLKPLADEGVLIVGSGGITHNLARLDWRHADAPPAPWAMDFVGAVDAALARGDLEALCDPWKHLAHGRECHPTLEHYHPFLVALGAAAAPLRPIHRDWTLGNLGLHTYATPEFALAALKSA